MTDVGRQRHTNEDNFYDKPPLFAVADGMGGAQAGEVASRLAAAAFREFHEADDLGPEERVAAIIQEANRRIYERAVSDTHASGMGTTITAALVAGDGLAIGHVGDSRAYRLRGGSLEQLTNDHSLVADLVRSGRLTPEEADTHPQRSVITRALGTDPQVDVDTFTVDADLEHDRSWHEPLTDYPHGPDRTRPHRPGRPPTPDRGGDPSSPPARSRHPDRRREPGPPTRSPRRPDPLRSVRPVGLDRAVTLDDPGRGHRHAVPDVGRVEDLQPGPDREHPAGRLVRPGEREPPVLPVLRIRGVAYSLR